MTGSFITFEGGEGAGKSTQVQILAERLRGMGRNVLVTREPGGTVAGEAIRSLLVSGDVSRWSALAEALLNNAAREQHLIEVIRPALEKGSVVLCDRFMDSTRVYQGYAGGCSQDVIDALEKAVVGETRPSRTLVFDLDPALGLARAKSRLNSAAEDRFERKGLDFHRNLRDGFKEIVRREPERCHLIDAARPVDLVAREVWATVSELW
ncbi:dTMP kinase [Aestuariivirga sp.]|jgi:dTMP kinase|uniref:dTMP kinase n=1 Tax=Aestuariivirga sp. TaxID=2650926 RepID=UPI003782FAE9